MPLCQRRSLVLFPQKDIAESKPSPGKKSKGSAASPKKRKEPALVVSISGCRRINFLYSCSCISYSTTWENLCINLLITAFNMVTGAVRSGLQLIRGFWLIVRTVNEFRKSHQLYCTVLYLIFADIIYKRAFHLVHVKMIIFHCWFWFFRYYFVVVQCFRFLTVALLFLFLLFILLLLFDCCWLLVLLLLLSFVCLKLGSMACLLKPGSKVL